MATSPCDRCGSLAYFRIEDACLALCCPHCGNLRWLRQETKEGMVIERRLPSSDPQAGKLPAVGSRLHTCFVALLDYGSQTTGEVAQDLGLGSKEVANSMAVLSARGLVCVIESNKGKKGGSLWGVTPLGRHLTGE